MSADVKHWVLFYEKAADHAAREGAHGAAHRAHVVAAARRGEVVLAGSLEEPDEGQALLVFRAPSAAVATAFAEADPYVVSGIVRRWWVRRWDTVAGEGAVAPLPELSGGGR